MVGGAIGAKAVAGVVTAAVITAGAAVEVKKVTPPAPAPQASSLAAQAPATIPRYAPAPAYHPAEAKAPHHTVAVKSRARKAPPASTTEDPATSDPALTQGTAGAHHKHPQSGGEAGASAAPPAVTVTVTGTPPPSPPPAEPTAPSDDPVPTPPVPAPTDPVLPPPPADEQVPSAESG